MQSLIHFAPDKKKVLSGGKNKQSNKILKIKRMGNIEEFDFDFSKLSKETISLMINVYNHSYKHTSINTVNSELYFINDCLLILNCTTQKDKTKEDIYEIYKIIRIDNKHIKLLDFLSKINKSQI